MMNQEAGIGHASRLMIVFAGIGKNGEIRKIKMPAIHRVELNVHGIGGLSEAEGAGKEKDKDKKNSWFHAAEGVHDRPFEKDFTPRGRAIEMLRLYRRFFPHKSLLQPSENRNFEDGISQSGKSHAACRSRKTRG
jgi:hypothetical protein